MKIVTTTIFLFFSTFLYSQVYFNDVFSAIERNDLSMVKKMLSNQNEIQRNQKGLSPISYAALLGRTAIVEYLISIGINIDFKEKEFVTPLMLACKNAQLETVTFLIKKGANINARTRNLRYSPLIYACKSHSFETFKLLVDNGADIRILTKYKNSLLHILADDNNQKILKILNDPILNDLNHNSFVSVSKYNEDTLKIAKFLIDKGLNINAQNDEGFTPIMYAIKNDNFLLTKFFIEKGANLTIANIYDETPLKLARLYQREEMIKIIKQNLSK